MYLTTLTHSLTHFLAHCSQTHIQTNDKYFFRNFINKSGSLILTQFESMMFAAIIFLSTFSFSFCTFAAFLNRDHTFFFVLVFEIRDRDGEKINKHL